VLVNQWLFESTQSQHLNIARSYSMFRSFHSTIIR